MTKLYRYMSIYEFLKMSIGEEIQPINNCSKTKRTNSKGVCFLGEKTFDSEDFQRQTPEACISFLGGIVSNDILVEFEIKKLEDISESFGEYASVDKIPEYWLESYNKKKLTPLRYKIAIGQYFEEDDWEKYNEIDIEKGPKDILKRIVEKRHNESYPSVTTLEDWCSEFSAIYPDNEGWYIEKNLKEGTMKLAFGNLYSTDSEHEKFSLCFTQESIEEGYHPTLKRKVKIANYNFKLSNNIPREWETLKEDFEKVAEKQILSERAYVANATRERIKDNEFSRLGGNSRIVTLCKYSMLKYMYPDLMDKYKLNFDASYPSDIFESIGIESIFSEKQISVIKFDSLEIYNNNGKVEYSINNFNKNKILLGEPIRFKSTLGLNRETLEEQEDILSKDEMLKKLLNRTREIEEAKDEQYRGG